MIWLLLISDKGGYKVHSLHHMRDDAVAWQKCKEHDGEDTALAAVPLIMLEEFVSAHTKA